MKRVTLYLEQINKAAAGQELIYFLSALNPARGGDKK
jgi:hypothetical protein